MLKILIADDECLEREQLNDIICRRMPREAEVRMAENGRRCVEIASLWGADLILMDMKCPEWTVWRQPGGFWTSAHRPR